MNKQHRSYRDRQQRYSVSNPPLSQEEGLRRLQEVFENIARIEADLLVKTERDLGTLDALDEWKIKAARALKYSNVEKNFLLRFTGQMKKIDPEKIPSDPKKLSRLNKIVSEFIAHTPYQSVGSPAIQFTSREEIRARQKKIRELRTAYQGLFMVLKAESRALDCAPVDYDRAREVVVAIMNEMIEESDQLKLNDAEMVNRASAQKTNSTPSFESPRPSDDPRLPEILNKISAVKRKLNMSSPEMTEWLLTIICKQRRKVFLYESEQQILHDISTYVKLTNERKSIEYA